MHWIGTLHDSLSLTLKFLLVALYSRGFLGSERSLGGLIAWYEGFLARHDGHFWSSSAS